MSGQGLDVIVKLAPDEGSTFRIWLPAVTETTAVPPPASPTRMEGHAGDTILVVDDERSMRESLAAWLKEDGYEVDAAGSGAEAVEMAQPPPSKEASEMTPSLTAR